MTPEAPADTVWQELHGRILVVSEDPLFWKPSPLVVDPVARGATLARLNQSI